MNPIINDRSLPVEEMYIPQIDSESKSVAQATQMEADNAVDKGDRQTKGVELPPPKPGVNQQVTAQQQQELEQLIDTVKRGTALTAKLTANIPLLVNLALTSPDEFEIEMGKITSEMEKILKEIELEKIEKLYQENLKQISENLATLKQAEEAAEKAQKSGLVNKIFGWISAIVSVVIGAIMIATGAGAVAGAMMIAGATMGLNNMAMQQAAEDGLISKEAMATLGPVLMAVEIAVAIASMVVTFGAGAAGAIAKVGAQIGGKVAEITAKLAVKAAELAAKFSSAASTISKSVRFGTGVADLMFNIITGVTKTVDSAYQAELQNKRAELLENQQILTAFQGMLDKLKESLSQMTEAFQQTMEMIFQMITAKGAMLNNLAGRPAAI